MRPNDERQPEYEEDVAKGEESAVEEEEYTECQEEAPYKWSAAVYKKIEDNGGKPRFLRPLSCRTW